MTKNTIYRKAQIVWLDLRIGALGLLMRLEDAGPITDRWKRLACRQGGYIQQRNKLRTPAEIREIERKRGLV
ncbi:hypothetical protein [Marinobacter sp. MDS2]|uniref:hypothetical protein n=1 Tax=Marinobacter sp. MDS2 TaxID=3065961 RepID=UPI00273C7235|nr:hypothetical protein [Marinobacter sp. MDS2]MDP4546516.1 hypothetical protein [Marinobacter sp. MDS2]